MKQWFSIRCAFLISVILASICHQALAFEGNHKTSMECYLYVSQQCTDFFNYSSYNFDICLDIGEIFCDIIYGKTYAASAWNDLNRMASSTGTQQDCENNESDDNGAGSIILDISHGSVTREDAEYNNLDIPYTLVWGLSSCSVTREGGGDDAEPPDILLWDFDGGDVSH